MKLPMKNGSRKQYSVQLIFAVHVHETLKRLATQKLSHVEEYGIFRTNSF